MKALYKEYQFDEVVDAKRSKKGRKQWNYFVVCLNPSISIPVDDDKRKKAEFCRVLAINFYNSIFERDVFEEDTQAMAAPNMSGVASRLSVVAKDFTIMIAAVHQDPVSMPTRHLSSMFEIMPESIFVVSAITYRKTDFDNKKVSPSEVKSSTDNIVPGVYCIILWMAVSSMEHSNSTPIIKDGKLKSWRKLGFGCFAIQLMTKHCEAIQLANNESNNIVPVTVFVQCKLLSALTFFPNVGFALKWDDPKNDGFDSMPLMLQDALEPDRLQGISWTNYQDLSLIEADIPEEISAGVTSDRACPLFVLHPGKLKMHSDHHVVGEDPAESVQKVDPVLLKPPAVSSSAEKPVKWIPATWCSYKG